jgi:E3 ubiquitin-protein ligase HUWE1
VIRLVQNFQILGSSNPETLAALASNYLLGLQLLAGDDSLVRTIPLCFLAEYLCCMDQDMEQYLQLLGRPRQAGGAAPDPSTHPLMAEAPNRPATSNTTTHHHPRVSHRRVLRSSGLLGGDSEGGSNGLLTMIQDLIGEDGYHMVEQMMARGGGTADAIVEVRADGGAPISIAHLRAAHRSSPPTAPQSLDGPQQDAARQVQEFSPVATQQRWIDEGKMTQGKNVADRVSALASRIILTLLPDARTREAARLEKEKEQREKEEKEEKLLRDVQLQKEEETRKQAGEASNTTLSPPDPDPSQLNSDSNVAPEQASSAMDVEPPSTIGPSAPVVVPVGTTLGAVDIEMVDAVEPPEIETNSVPEGPLLEAAPAPTSDEPIMDRSEDVSAPATGASPEEESREAGPSAPAARITVIVNGASVDITDTGIDPTFLEALPDDMREEVLNQHLRERRAAQPVIRPAESQISPDFLEALPPEIRAEILQQEQEALGRARRERERAAAPNGAAPVGPSDIDSASFLASLDPQLRQAVLMEQEDGFLQTLPSALLAEATALFGGPRAGNPRTAPSNPASAPAARKTQVQRDSIQLLDKAGVAILVRLLFFPQVLRKNALHKVLMNLCENSKTRTDLFNLLLGILQDGTGDIATVDKSFSQLSFRSTKSQAGSSSKTPLKSKSGDVLLTPSTLAAGSTDSIPHLVTHRCLEALTFIVSANDSAAYYFLTEHESLPALKRSVSRKGKGKEKQTTQTQFPVVLLLGLLDREGLLRSPPMMGAVALLLASVTRPLSTLKDAPSEPPAGPAVSETGGSEPTIPISENPPLDSPGNIALLSLSSSADVSFSAAGGPPDSAPSISSKGIDLAQKLGSSPPQIPSSSLRLIANILTTGECSGRTFQLTLSLIQHLLCLPNAREIIAEELKTRAEQLGLSLRHDLDELTQGLEATQSGSAVQSSVVSKFSPASSDQAKLLRVLKTLDFMYTPRPSSSQSATPSDTVPLAQPSESEAEQVHKIYESFQFTPLWKRLGDSLSVVESKVELDHIATVLLPLIESLMVVCKHVGPKSGPSAAILAGSASPRSATSGRETAEDLFVNFTDAHRKVLNVMVRNNPSLMSGSFSLLVNNPKVLDFDNKRNYFGQQLRRRPHSREHHTTLQLNVRRPHVFEDSYQYLHRKTGDQIKYGKLNVRFYDEEGVDAGGVTREWFQILARRMFNPDYALFQPCAGDKLTYQPNRASSVNPEHLLFFKFVGRVIGKAIYDGRLLDAYFARSLYRQILGKPVDYRDVEWVDPEYYNSLCWILENDPSVLDMNFTVEADEVRSLTVRGQYLALTHFTSVWTAKSRGIERRRSNYPSNPG